MSSADA